METDPISEMFCFLVFRIPVILSVIYHRQNPLDSTQSDLCAYALRPEVML
jgi:hypothetical protein